MVLLLARVVPNPVAARAIPMNSREDYPDPNVRLTHEISTRTLMLVSPFELTFSLVPIRCVS